MTDFTDSSLLDNLPGFQEIAKDELGLRIVSAEQFANTDPAPRKWLLKNSFPAGKVGMVVGQGGVGKSFFTLQIGISVTTGIPVCGGLFDVEQTGSVLIVNAEDDEDEAHRRYWQLESSYKEASDAKLKISSQYTDFQKTQNSSSRLKFCYLSSGNFSFVDAGGNSTDFFDELISKARLLKDLRLIILDPLRRFLMGNEDSSEVASNFTNLTLNVGETLSTLRPK